MRFRLKTDFVSFAREQIRGGLWFKPAWWEAVARAPPLALRLLPSWPRPEEVPGRAISGGTCSRMAPMDDARAELPPPAWWWWVCCDGGVTSAEPRARKRANMATMER